MNELKRTLDAKVLYTWLHVVCVCLCVCVFAGVNVNSCLSVCFSLHVCSCGVCCIVAVP